MTDTTEDDIGQRLLAWRTGAKLSRQKAGEAIGITPTQVANVEKGGRKIKAEVRSAIEAHLAGQAQGTTTAPESPSAVVDTPAPEIQPEPSDDGEEASEAEYEEAIAEALNADPALREQILAAGRQIIAERATAALRAEEALRLTPILHSGAFPDDGVHRYSNSEGRTFKRCRRKWYISWYRRLGLPEKPVGTLAIGSRVHLALQSLYDVEPANPLEVLEASIQQDLLELQGDAVGVEQLMKDAALCRAMVEGYLEWIAEEGIDAGLTIVGAETFIEVDPQFALETAVHLIAKLDVRVLRDIDKARLFIDHKTVGSLSVPGLHMDEQMLHYHLCEFLDAQQAGGEHCAGAMYNMLRKVLRTEKANPPFYERVDVPHSITELESHWHRVRGQVRDILATRAALDAGGDHREVAYSNPTSTCHWDCQYFGICPMFDDGSHVEEYLSGSGHLVEVDPLERYGNVTGVFADGV